MADSIAQFFLQTFGAHCSQRAYRQRRGYRKESFTYGDVLGMAHSFAGTLQSHGVVKGDRVMLWAGNSAQWVACFFGCVLSGAIVVPMDDGASADFAGRVFRQVQAKMLAGFPASLQAFGAAGGTAQTFNLEELTARPPCGAPQIHLEKNDAVQIVFTSGTTAEPKGVVISHGNILANIAPLEREMQRYMKYERLVHPLGFLSLLPLSHVFGQFLGMFLPPLLGGTVIFLDELKPSEIQYTIRRERVSVLVSVPRVLQSLKQKIEREIEDRKESGKFHRRFEASSNQHFLRRWWTFRRIRRQFGWKFLAFIVGGAALDRETEEFWHRLGYAVIQGYGLTETTSLISVNHPFRTGRGSIGKVLPGREVKLAADGEILIRGGAVTSGYWDPAGSQAVSDDEGWYRTGDIGGLDEAGNLYFKGRKKEVIVTPGGTNIYPEDLEAALRRQPEVKDCAVVAIDRDGNAEPCAVVILRDHEPLANVVQRANQSLADYQRIRMWLEWPQDDFPRTNTQKAKRNVIAEFARDRLQEREPTLDEASITANRLNGSALSSLIERISGRPAKGLSPSSSLDSDLGLSSLDRVELLGALEDRYQIDLSETRFNSIRTVGDLEGMLRGETPPATGYHYPWWALRWPVRAFRLCIHYLLMWPAIIVLSWPRIMGRENLRELKGPLLVISNHVADIDPGFILTALTARFRHRLATAAGGEALEALHTPPVDRNFFLRIYDRAKWILGVSLLNLFPLPREAGFRRSFAYAGEAVDRGYSILVFPEGRITTTGEMNPFRSGIGLLAQNLGIPVLPMRIDGLFEPRKRGQRFVRPNTICVRIGRPLSFPPGMDPEKIAADLRRAVQLL
ncbi:MAG TPA: AMP-binding protein [Candidatus Sulfotelmatobacter sp.]|nr:AMP-binding protein [Candidatus Sulfotelmatobacter sp.]